MILYPKAFAFSAVKNELQRTRDEVRAKSFLDVFISIPPYFFADD